MKKQYAKITLTTLALSAAFVCQDNFGLAKDKIIFRSMEATLDPLPPPKVLHGSVVESTAPGPPATNVFGYAERGSLYPTTITYVAPDSVAWLRGLQPGDHVVAAHVTPEKAVLIVQRGQKKYSCVLRTGALSALTGLADNSDGKKLSAKAEHSDTRTLATYAITMVVDNSASMGTKDCPGGISRWQWCKDHISDLYVEDKGVLQKNISIVTFDSNFHSRQNCSPGELQSVFAGGNPGGETIMAPALEEAFLLVRSQLSSGRPAIVAVISDGRPSDADNVKKTIIKETNVLSRPKLLTIVFIEVGTPEHYLQELDNDLVKQGAAADIVKVIPFSAASSQGLSKTLASTVPKPPPENSPKTSLSATVSTDGPNKAKEAVASHIFIYTPPGPDKKPAPQPTPRPQPPVVPAPPIKAHPTGVSAEAAAAVAKPLEVDEKAATLKNSANKTYK